MRVLSTIDVKTFEQLTSLTQSAMIKVLSEYLKDKYKEVVTTKEYIYAEGDIPVALVAHMDTVFAHPPVEVFYDRRKGVMWSPTGLGADDRAGIFCILKILQTGMRPHVIFTTDEEIGGVGSEILSNLPCPFKDLRYIVQLDRRGDNDCVFYDCDNQNFTTYIESFGFAENFGSFTDISHLCPKWGIAGVNLSVGYRDEHSASEVLFINPMLMTIQKVIKMLQDANKAPIFQYIPSKYSYMINYDNYWSESTSMCDKCHEPFLEEELIPIFDKEGKVKLLCTDCLVKNIENIGWCEQCSTGFEKVGDEVLCPTCREKNKKKRK